MYTVSHNSSAGDHEFEADQLYLLKHLVPKTTKIDLKVAQEEKSVDQVGLNEINVQIKQKCCNLSHSHLQSGPKPLTH